MFMHAVARLPYTTFKSWGFFALYYVIDECRVKAQAYSFCYLYIRFPFLPDHLSLSK